MDILQLTYFKKVAECKNMTTASQELMVAQPAVSKMIKKLETDIGYPLFDRKGRNIVLNRNGEILLAYADAIFNDMQSARDEIDDYNDSQSRSVNIQLRAGSKLFPDIVTSFIRLYPECKLHVDQSGYQVERDYDLTIYSSQKAPDREGRKVVLTEEILLIVPVTHWLADTESVSIAELQKEDFLVLKKGMDFRAITDSLCAMTGFVPHITFECDNPSFLREILSIGLGISFMPAVSWGHISSTPRTKTVKLEGGPFFRQIIIAWNTRRYLHSMARNFRDFLVSYYEKLQE
jgi:DNA-binding transcriptional LysR family regulator